MNPTLFNEDYLQPLTDNLAEQNKKIYITGDFNFDLLNTEHAETFNFFETMMSNHLLPTITVPTEINKKHSTVIDNIFTNQIHPDMKTGNLSVGISDHLISFLAVPRDNQNHMPKKNNYYVRCTKKFIREEFILDYLEIDWDVELEAHKRDTNHSTNIFFTRIEGLLDKHMPLRKMTQKEFKKRYKPWITDEIIEMINKKDAIFKKYIKAKMERRRQELHDEYKQLKNNITDLTRRKEKEHYDTYFTTNKKNLQMIWKGIKEVINIKSKSFSQPNCIIEKGTNKTITEPKEIATSFNKYFTSIAEDILNKRKYTGNKNHKEYLRNPNRSTFAVYECDPVEVENLITQLNPNKKSGPKSIPVNILQMLKKDISYPLSTIFNVSLTTGVHPDSLKIAKTIPIFKKGSKLETGNYRPISLLSNINKLLEKLMYARIYKFLDKMKCFYKLQFGFRNRHSTAHALIEITEKIRQALDNGMSACGVFIDLQKAFDTVNHSILLDKLEYYGIRGISNNWFKSYLTNRTQYVSIQGYDSKAEQLKHGVPQGSVLGPLLFLIYINDLHVAIHNSHVYHFADDTNLLNINNSAKKLQKQINYDLKCLYKWLLANKISLNCAKTELIFFHKPNSNMDTYKSLKIKMNGHKLVPSEYIKYLGMYIDSTLSGKHHCDILNTKLKRANGMLSKIRHYVPREELQSIYHAIFSSHMIYGCQVWGQGDKDNLEKICKLQNRALRTINFEGPRAESNNLYAGNKILKLEDFIKLNNCLFIHDHIHKNLPECFENYFLTLNSLYFERTKNAKLGCIFVPFKNSTKYGLNSITHQSLLTWNKITKELKTDLSKMSRHDLKSLLVRYFLSKYGGNNVANIIINNNNNNNNNRNRDRNRKRNHDRNNINNARADNPRRQVRHVPSRWGEAVPGAVPIPL